MRPVEAWILVFVFALMLACLTALNNSDKKIREANMGVACVVALLVMGYAAVRCIFEMAS